MNYILGSAIKLKTEVSIVAGTTGVVDLYDPDGLAILTDEEMSFDTVSTSVLFKVWQSAVSTHSAGRYKFITTTTNGGFENSAKGFFFLEDE